MVQLSTPWGDPNRGMGPPWGAFCQITLTSCLNISLAAGGIRPMFSICPFLCLLPNLWIRYFENESTSFDANWHKWSLHWETEGMKRPLTHNVVQSHTRLKMHLKFWRRHIKSLDPFGSSTFSIVYFFFVVSNFHVGYFFAKRWILLNIFFTCLRQSRPTVDMFWTFPFIHSGTIFVVHTIFWKRMNRFSRKLAK